ncbi:hypothetical protein DJ531_07105, partial [Sulfolobus sp. A20-N-F6]
MIISLLMNFLFINTSVANIVEPNSISISGKLDVSLFTLLLLFNPYAAGSLTHGGVFDDVFAELDSGILTLAQVGNAGLSAWNSTLVSAM